MADDDGKYRILHNIAEIHNEFNSIENNDPKNKYAEKVKRFLKHYGYEY